MGGSIPREYSTENKSIDNVGGVLCCYCGASASVAVLVNCRGQREKARSCWYVTDEYFLCCFLLDMLLAADCCLITSSELYRTGRPGGLSSGYVRVLLAWELECDSHSCEI